MASSWIIDATDETFEQAVFEESHRRLVVLDFWASWCQPCLMLKPVLEAVATAYEGRFQLVKADTDQLQQEAMHFGVQSIPAVFAVVDGQPVSGFQGAMSETEVRAWVDRVLQVADLSKARRLEASEPGEALRLYEQLLSDDAANASAWVGKGRVLLAQGDREAAQEILRQLDQRGFLEEEAKNFQAALDLAELAESVDVAELKTLCEQQPDNRRIRVELGKALAGAGSHAEALDLLLDVVAAEGVADKGGAGEHARLAILEVFRVLPDDSELTRQYRRKLSSLLF